jgi:integrase
MAKYIIERERNGKKEICVVIPYRDSKGNRRQIWRSASSKTEAITIRNEELRKIEKRGTKVYEHRMVLNEYLNKWLASIEQKVEEVTLEDYAAYLRRYVRPSLGSLKVSEVTTEHIQDIVNDMQKRRYEARTIEFMHRVISLALKRAILPPWNLIAFNPADYVELPKKKKKERVWLTDETMQKFLDVLDTNRHGLMLEFALVSGMRCEEYLALRWEPDLDFAQCTASVNQTLYIRRGMKRKRELNPDEPSWLFEEPKNESSRRLVPIPRYLMQKLLEHKRKQNEQRLRMGNKWRNYGLVFCSSIGTPLNLSNIHYRYYKPLLKKIELEDKKSSLEKMRLYDLRHSFASLLLKTRENKPAVPLRVVSEMLGHNDPYTTARIYQHVDESQKRQASDTMASIVRENRQK